ncbi:PREDICTED: binding partner of ACD11 1 isoform X2 [Tarenaya hassleriana]|nr:PREDICTED: binding partner of ACD11 1 isoform X2 [Tarenaya hassleriana]XP_010556231.1 PREDICTED: binding partner of ACD11 1 isoform X2 [Tarenaya hassleriana]
MNPQSTLLGVRTVKISNVSLAASKRDIKEFFSFSGDIRYVEMRRETEVTQVAYVTFKDPQGAETAMLLTGAVIGDLPISITPAEDYQLPYEALFLDSESSAATGFTVKKAEDVVSTMLAKGYALGKDAMEKAKEFDDRHHFTSNASATIASIDQKMGLSEKLSIGTAVVNGKFREMDERYQVTEITKSAFAVAEQKAISAGTAIMSNPYVSTGASWFSNAFSAVAKAAGDVGILAKEKALKSEEENLKIGHKETGGTIDHLEKTSIGGFSTRDPPVVPVSSVDP